MKANFHSFAPAGSGGLVAAGAGGRPQGNTATRARSDEGAAALAPMLVARESFDVVVGGRHERITAGISRVRAGHEIVRGRENLFAALPDGEQVRYRSAVRAIDPQTGLILEDRSTSGLELPAEAPWFSERARELLGWSSRHPSAAPVAAEPTELTAEELWQRETARVAAGVAPAGTHPFVVRISRRIAGRIRDLSLRSDDGLETGGFLLGRFRIGPGRTIEVEDAVEGFARRDVGEVAFDAELEEWHGRDWSQWVNARGDGLHGSVIGRWHTHPTEPDRRPSRDDRISAYARLCRAEDAGEREAFSIALIVTPVGPYYGPGGLGPARFGFRSQLHAYIAYRRKDGEGVVEEALVEEDH